MIEIQYLHIDTLKLFPVNYAKTILLICVIW